MRKLLQFVFLFITFYSLNLAAQPIMDDMESYDLGGAFGQVDYITTWSGGAGDEGEFSDEQAASGSQSMYIGPGGAIDMLWLLGDQSEGSYTVAWKCYVPAGSTGYYNIQDTEAPGVFWNLNVFYALDLNGDPAPGTGIVTDDTNAPLDEFTYPEDTWFDVLHEIDMDNDLITIYLDGEPIYTGDYDGNGADGGNLGSINFYSIDANNQYYIDDLNYFEGFGPASVDVTFAVDMNYEDVSEDGVHLVGSFNDWDPTSHPMTDDDEDGIYEITASIPQDSSYTYQFVNGNTLDGAEAVPADCGVDSEGNTYRELMVGEEAITLDAVCFAECADCASTKFVDVTFQVDMYGQEVGDDIGMVLEPNFNPTTDLVPMTLVSGSEDIYEVTASVVKDRTYTYAYVNGGSTESLFGQDCANENGLRTIEVATDAITNDAECFGSCDGAGCWRTGIETLDENTLALSPNPTNGLVNIEHPFVNENINISVYNSLGQLMKAVEVKATTNAQQINLNDFAADLYFVKVSNGTQQVAQRLLLVD